MSVHNDHRPRDAPYITQLGTALQARNAVLSKDMSFENRSKTEQLRIATAKPSAINLSVGIEVAEHGDNELAWKAERCLLCGR